MPNVEGLGLENIGVEFDSEVGVKVNDTLETTIPNIYAVGDCCSKLHFTHNSDTMA